MSTVEIPEQSKFNLKEWTSELEELYLNLKVLIGNSSLLHFIRYIRDETPLGVIRVAGCVVSCEKSSVRKWRLPLYCFQKKLGALACEFAHCYTMNRDMNRGQKSLDLSWEFKSAKSEYMTETEGGDQTDERERERVVNHATALAG